jgi:hypothetical protein
MFHPRFFCLALDLSSSTLLSPASQLASLLDDHISNSQISTLEGVDRVLPPQRLAVLLLPRDTQTRVEHCESSKIRCKEEILVVISRIGQRLQDSLLEFGLLESGVVIQLGAACLIHISWHRC